MRRENAKHAKITKYTKYHSIIFVYFVIFACFAFSLPAKAQPPNRKKPETKQTQPAVDDDRKRAAELFEAGQNAHQSGDLNKAIELYNEALKRDPEMWQAEFQRGIAFLSLNRQTEAKDSITKARALLAQYPDSPELKQVTARIENALGEVALAESKPEEAEKFFKNAIQMNPQIVRAHSGLAEALLAQGKRDEAIAEARAAISAGDDRSATFSLIGAAQTVNGNYDEALINLNESLKRDPKNVLALLYRAEVYIAKKRLNPAIDDLRAALEIEPNIKTKLRLAAVYLEARRGAEAVAIYEDVLKTDPANQDARTGLAAAMIDSGKGGEAIAQLESLIKTEPGRADLRAQLAELYLPSQPERALEQYTAAAKIEPSRVNHRIGVGSALVKLRRFPEAIAVLTTSLAQSPKDDVAYPAHANLATAYFELDDYPNAAKEFIWLLEHQNRDQRRVAITLYFLGICFDKLGDLEQALKAYQQFLTLASAENQLEIDKVKLRLPSLQRQIKEGKGKKRP